MLQYSDIGMLLANPFCTQCATRECGESKSHVLSTMKMPASKQFAQCSDKNTLEVEALMSERVVGR